MVTSPLVHDLRHGRWQTVLNDVVMVDSIITDPPYSERVIKNQRSGGPGNYRNAGKVVAKIPYAHLTQEMMAEFISSWAPRVRSWMVIFGDHYMMRWIEDLLPSSEWMFWHRVWLKSDGGTPRFSGEGPDEDVEHVAICRPRRRVKVKHRPGSFYTPRQFAGDFAGQKPLALMRDAVLRYSEPGDRVCDPFMGSGTTGVACVENGRLFVGSEMDDGRFTLASERVTAASSQVTLFSPADTVAQQARIFDEATMRGTRSRKVAL